MASILLRIKVKHIIMELLKMNYPRIKHAFIFFQMVRIIKDKFMKVNLMAKAILFIDMTNLLNSATRVNGNKGNLMAKELRRFTIV
jgi:hypothetical protein